MVTHGHFSGIGILGDDCMAIELTNYGNIKELKYHFPYYPPVIKRGWLEIQHLVTDDFPSQPPLITSCWRSFLKAMGHLIVSPEKCRKIWETLKISGKHPRTTILKTCFYLSWVYYMVTVSGQCFASG
jgi:hypothetical protein